MRYRLLSSKGIKRAAWAKLITVMRVCGGSGCESVSALLLYNVVVGRGESSYSSLK